MRFEFHDWEENDGFHECIVLVEKEYPLRCRAVRNSLGNYIPCVRTFEGYGTLDKEDPPVESLEMAKIVAEKLGMLYAYEEAIDCQKQLFGGVRDILQQCWKNPLLLVMAASTKIGKIECNGFDIEKRISNLLNLPHIDE